MFLHCTIYCAVASMWKSTMKTPSHIAVRSATRRFRTPRTFQSTCDVMTPLPCSSASAANTAPRPSSVYLDCVNTPRKSISKDRSRLSASTVTDATPIDVLWRIIWEDIRLWGRLSARLVERALSISPIYRNMQRFAVFLIVELGKYIYWNYFSLVRVLI